MTSGKKVIVTSLVKSTSMIENKISIEEFGDWIPTLRKRGFEDIIQEFIASIKYNKKFFPNIEDSLITHNICENIVNLIENDL